MSPKQIVAAIILIINLSSGQSIYANKIELSKLTKKPENLKSKESTKIKEIISSYAGLHRFNGAILVARNNKIIFAGGFGTANIKSGIPNSEKTLFNLGSLSKQFTAAAILKLEAEGKVSVNDPVSKYLPDYPLPQGNLITIHNLLTHTSGIPSLWRTDGIPDVKPGSEAITLDNLVAIFKNKELKFPPGTKYNYSNSGYILLAAIIEKVSKMPYDDYLKLKLFKSAGMKNTGRFPSSDKNTATGYLGYYPNLEEVSFEHPSWNIGAGSIYSNIEDLFKWEKALTEGKILPPEELAKFFKAQVKRGSNPNAFYGYGWFIEQENNRLSISHNGTTEGFIAEYHRFPQEKLLIIALSNFLPAFGINIPIQVVGNIDAGLRGEKYDHPPIAAKLNSEQLQLLTGDYELETGYNIAVRLENGQLVAEAAGEESWSLATYHREKLEKNRADSSIALKVIKGFIDGNFQFIKDLLPPRRKESFQPEIIDHIKQQTDVLGKLLKMTPIEEKSVSTDKFVYIRLTFKGGEKIMRVELNEKNELVGWGFNNALPSKVNLIPESATQFFVDGFPYEEKDLHLNFTIENNHAVKLEILNKFDKSFVALRKL